MIPAGFVVHSASDGAAKNDGDDRAEDYLGAAGDALEDLTGFPKRSVLEVNLGAGHCICAVSVSAKVMICVSRE